MPKVSVIVPVYNVEKYLNRCLDSILAQTFKDFELILIDDGSIDNSGVICDDYAKKDERIKVLHKTNGGLSDARNAGIDVASGEYLSFIDSDDWVEKNFIEVLYGNAVKNNADISAVNLHKVYDTYEEKKVSITEGCYSNIDAMNFLYGDASIYANVACNKLYKKGLFESVRYPKGKTHEDGFTTYKLLYYTKRVYFSNECLYNYYQRSGSIMNKKFNINRVHEYEVYCERKRFFGQNSLSDLTCVNEKTRLACMKTLTINLIKYGIAERKKYLSIFKKDVKSNFDIMNENVGTKGKVVNEIFKCEPMLFAIIYFVKNFLKTIRRKIKEIKVMTNLVIKTTFSYMSRKKTVFMIMTPIGGNLGDHALLYAEKKLFTNMKVIELPCPYSDIYIKHMKVLKKLVGQRTILFTAGGNLGTLWFKETELPMRKIISEFHGNDIIILPNTCFYENSTWGKEEQKKSIEIYNGHPKLRIYARERISYEIMKDMYNDVQLMPDMVMYLNEDINEVTRDSVLLCLRNDIEKTMSEETEKLLVCAAESISKNVKFTDTVVSGNISARNRKKEILMKLKEFSAAKLVVTDRLHGMVFAAITGTPCVVVNSKSHKLLGCYEWIRHLRYIKFIDNIDDLKNISMSFMNGKHTYDNSNLLHYYNDLYSFVAKKSDIRDDENARK